MTTKNLQTLRIHELSDDQYKEALAAGNIEDYSLYLIPEEDYVVDSELSDTSTNPVQNLVIKAELDNIKALIENAGGSEEVLEAIQNLQNQLNEKAAAQHEHSTTEITSGVLPIERGGTGAATAEEARANLGISAGGGSLSDLGVTATAEELNKLSGLVTTATELSYVNGATSNIQTQLNNLGQDLRDLDQNVSNIGANAVLTTAQTLSDTQKSQARNNINAADASAVLPYSGGTMTGAITLNGIKLTSGTDYGTSFPSDVTAGRLFYKKVGS